MRATWLADVLRSSGVRVVEHVGWEARGNDEFAEIHACVWHHDGSPPGASPNVAAYILGQVEAGKPGANLWVALDGTWHVIAGRMTYHAGKVLPGKPDNHHSIGIETDHTTGETWSGVNLLASLRHGTAAILSHLGIGPASGLEFHKTICSPPGRKTDPDGLHLADERAAVARIMAPVTAASTTPEPAPAPVAVTEEDDDTVFTYRDARDNQVWIVERGQRRKVERPELKAYIAAGVLTEPKVLKSDDAAVMEWNYPEKK